ncbi:MAG: hypothetical protein JEY99_15065, partial [Spirochaetales bacterium]|nr:hypothetical protein [Spirochaetales bacterium]
MFKKIQNLRIIMLFESKFRNDNSRYRENESNYGFLDRSSREIFNRVRNYLNEWYEEYPKEHTKDLEKRLKDFNEENFYGAFTELCFYMMLKKMDFNIEIHPEIENCNEHPDFLILKNNEKIAYFEATTSNKKHFGKTETKHAEKIIEYLNDNLESKVFVNITFEQISKEQPKLKEIKDSIQNIIIKNDINSEKHISVGSWRIKLGFIESKEGKVLKRPIGLESFGVKFIDSRKSLLNTLRKKAKKYKHINLPLIVAVNVLDGFLFEPAYSGETCHPFRLNPATCEHFNQPMK